MNFDVAVWPFFVQNVLQFVDKPGSSIIALSGREYPIVQLSHIATQLLLLVWVEVFFGH